DRCAPRRLHHSAGDVRHRGCGAGSRLVVAHPGSGRLMAGELIQGDWQFEFRGLLLAKSEGYRVRVADGLDTLPDVRRSKVPRPRASGSLLLPNYADERVVTLEMRILGDTD